jgi:glycosyltransferase 2 family protein
VIAMAIVVSSALALFGNKIPPEIASALKLTGLCLLAVLVLVGVFFHSHKHFPLKLKSERLQDLIDSFHQGLRFRGKLIPLFFITTTAIWFLEGGRFFFVCKSMAVDISLVSVLFISTCSALLTAFPFTPSGLGAVELGMAGLLTFVGVQSSVAYPTIMVDRLIAHWSQLLLGIVFVLFNKAIRLRGWEFRDDDEAPSPKKDLAVL